MLEVIPCLLSLVAVGLGSMPGNLVGLPSDSLVQQTLKALKLCHVPHVVHRGNNEQITTIATEPS